MVDSEINQPTTPHLSFDFDARYMRANGGSVTLNTDRFTSRKRHSAEERGRTRTISSIAPLPESCYTINTFLFFLSCFQVINLLTLTYTGSVINYIAKTFNIPNTMASFIPSSYQIGNMVVLIPVSFFGAKWNRPRVIGVGVMIMIVGLVFCALPHFLAPPPKVINSTHNDLCTTSLSAANSTSAKSEIQDKAVLLPNGLTCNEKGSVYNPALLLIIGNILVGIGAAPIWPLGVSYIDDHVVIRKAPLYIGIFVGTTLSGPIFGFLLGSLTSSIYVTLDPHNIKPSNPSWIGAWWLGYLIACIALVLLLFPFYFYPRSLPISAQKQAELSELEFLQSQRNRSQTGLSTSENELPSQAETSMSPSEAGSNAAGCSSAEQLAKCEDSLLGQIVIKATELACAMKKTVSTPLVLAALVSYIPLANILSGVNTFGATYVQRAFNVSRTTSDLLLGGICLPMGIIATFVGGYVMKKYNFDIRQTIIFTTTMSGIACISLIAILFIGCEYQDIVGVSKSQTTSMYYYESCSHSCHCAEGELLLVCGSNEVTYLSPCHAGCRRSFIKETKFLKEKVIYRNCSCVEDEKNTAVTGSCSTTFCTGELVAFMIMGVFGIFFVCLCQAPVYIILLRVIDAENKSLGIGLMSFISRVLGNIPAPIWFGMILDRSCIYWSPKCMGKASCLLYNIAGLRLSFIGLLLAWGLVYLLVFLATFVFMECNKDQYEKSSLMHELNSNNDTESERARLLR